ncbi:hypothetical protein Smic_58060 [Streptomyces microflavus]|uniref:Uncharacterized protein n=1 Tax=Streptomyces microflavus TaxID=1919 RepID=A0A7J0CXI4_STRMI|nr:hypothetical protein Smic_58060 [Streptomyces microflavus]
MEQARPAVPSSGSISVADTRENPVTGRPLPANHRCRGSHSWSSGARDGSRAPSTVLLGVALFLVLFARAT